MAIRIPVTLIIKMDDDQVAAWYDEYTNRPGAALRLAEHGFRAQEAARQVVRDSVRACVLAMVRDSEAFGALQGRRGGDVSIEEADAGA
jgi:hypothetical protein